MKGIAAILVASLLLTTVASFRRERRRERSATGNDAVTDNRETSTSNSYSRSSDNEDSLRNCTVTRIDTAIDGQALTYCRSDRRQCCSETFLMDRRLKLKEELLASLKDELSANGELLDSIVARLKNFLGYTFIDRFLNKLNTSYVNEPGFVEPFADAFRENLVIVQGSNFSVSSYVQRIVNSVVTAIIDEYIVPRLGDPTEDERACIIRNLLTPGVLDDIVGNFTLLRRAFSTLLLINNFYNKLERNITTIGYRLSDRCIDAFLELRCEGCRRFIPRTCRNTCGALVRGCYAALLEILTNQLNLLWRVVDQIVDRITTAVRVLLADSCQLIAADASNLGELIARISNICGLSSGTTDVRRQADGRPNDSDTGGNSDGGNSDGGNSDGGNSDGGNSDGGNSDSDRDGGDGDTDTGDGGDSDNGDSDRGGDTNDADDTGANDIDDANKVDSTDGGRGDSDSSRSTTSDGVPNAVIVETDQLRGRGAFNYGNGPRYCRFNRHSNCWNGTHEVEVDTLNFTGVTIIDQLTNPVFMFTEDDVIAAEALINEIGSPVTNFLMSQAVQDVVPEGVNLTETGEAIVDPEVPGSASLKVASLLAVLITAVLAILL